MAGRTWVAVMLSFGVWFAYIKFFAPPMPDQTAAKQEGAASTDSSKANVSVPGQTAQQADAFLKTPVIRTDLTTSTPVADYGFSLSGGKLSEVTLKKYHETVKETSPHIKVIDAKANAFALATLFTSPELQDLAFGGYKVVSQGPKEFVFSKTATNGVKLTKVYELSEDGYLSQMRLVLGIPEAIQGQDLGAMWIPVGGTGLRFEASEPDHAWEALVYQDDSLTRKPLGDLEAETLQGTTEWMAFGNRYFATALVNQSSINPDVELVGGEGFKGAYMKFPLHLKKGENEISFKFQLYSGPKDIKELEGVGSLKKMVDFGMFAVVAYPLLRVLKFFYSFVHNWGVAIILLTILVRLLFYPLTAKSMKSMKAMQKLQPHIAALKEKHKDDRDKLNREQMALFKTHKVNPAAGCFPMLIQLPVFIALYQVLANSMELYHAPFFGWIHDLSAKDPYYIYPALMGIAMFAQQKMTPAAGMEPAQQKMMLFMPIIFTFLMVSLPSGLTLYIFVSTLLGIVQQVLTTRKNEPALVPVKTASKTAPEKT